MLDTSMTFQKLFRGPINEANILSVLNEVFVWTREKQLTENLDLYTVASNLENSHT